MPLRKPGIYWKIWSKKAVIRFSELTARYNIKDFAKSIEASEHPIYEIVTMMTEEDQHKFLALAGIRRTILVQ
jgi:hypothetical protein